MNQTEFENILKRRLYKPTLRAEQHLELCTRIADVPWAYGDTRAEFMGARIDDLFGDITVTRGHMRLSGQDTPAFIDIARRMLVPLELEYVASALCPTAEWEFDHGFAVMQYARIHGIEITRLAHGDWTIELRDANGFVGSICATTASEVVATWRDYRAEHEAARGVKTRTPKPGQQKLCLPPWIFWGFEAKPQPEWRPPALDDLTIKHARNIVACLANPDKYTRIATWAAGNPNALLRVVSRALDVK